MMSGKQKPLSVFNKMGMLSYIFVGFASVAVLHGAPFDYSSSSTSTSSISSSTPSYSSYSSSTDKDSSSTSGRLYLSNPRTYGSIQDSSNRPTPYGGSAGTSSGTNYSTQRNPSLGAQQNVNQPGQLGRSAYPQTSEYQRQSRDTGSSESSEEENKKGTAGSSASSSAGSSAGSSLGSTTEKSKSLNAQNGDRQSQSGKPGLVAAQQQTVSRRDVHGSTGQSSYGGNSGASSSTNSPPQRNPLLEAQRNGNQPGQLRGPGYQHSTYQRNTRDAESDESSEEDSSKGGADSNASPSSTTQKTKTLNEQTGDKQSQSGQPGVVAAQQQSVLSRRDTSSTTTESSEKDDDKPTVEQSDYLVFIASGRNGDITTTEEIIHIRNNQ